MPKTKEDVIKVVDGRLIIDVAIDVKGKASASGKSLVKYSTHGNVDVDDGAHGKIGINYYTKK